MSSNAAYPLVDLRAMFYLVTPNETSFERLTDVPNYVDRAVPYFVVLVILETIVLKLQGKPLPRMNDSINSMTHGILSTLNTLVFRSIELFLYSWIYENYCLWPLPWDSGWGWLLGLIGVDFVYYWFHRFSHESNIIWASHQVHHSSEDYNLTTALRQSVWQKYYSMCMYFGLALFLPPSVFYVHVQFNLLYQFWIHTEAVKLLFRSSSSSLAATTSSYSGEDFHFGINVIDNIGPLEFILNTPSHHRVHHGRNPYCIDKNYGGTLIIWDRMFNTFQAEGEKVIYGLVHPNKFWNPFYSQIYHYLYILGLVKQHKGLSNKISAVVKGPGWEPGKPWTGLLEDIPQVEQPVRKYDSDVPTWANVYMGIHFAIIITFYGSVSPYKQQLTALSGLACILYFIISVSSFGFLYDNKKFAALFEFARCVATTGAALYLKGDSLFQDPAVIAVVIVFFLSSALWGSLTCLQYQLNVKAKKVD